MFFLTPHSAEKFLPKAYNSFAGEFSETRQRKWQEFDDLARENYSDIKTQKILDIGCGNGRLRKFLAERNFSGEYFARDVAENFLDHAKQNLQEFSDTKSGKLHFSQGGFLDLLPEFSDNYFDEVWAVASFHHLSQDKDRKKALQDIQKILKPEGEIILTVWNLSEQKKYDPQKKEAFWRSVWNPLFSERDFLIPWGVQKTPRYYYSFSEEYLTKLLLEAGFEIQKIFYSEKRRNLCVRAKKITNIKNNINKNQKFLVKKIQFDITTEEKVLEKMIACVGASDICQKIYTPNPEMTVETQKNPENPKFLEVLNRADISLADGNGILWASGLSEISHLEGKFWLWKKCVIIYSLLKYAFLRKTYTRAVEKPICGSDIFQKFLEKTKNLKNSENSNPAKIFLLGGERGSAEYIQKNYPQICGIFDGFVNEKTKSEISQKILRSGANVLFVALGAPKQEFFIDEFIQNSKISDQLAFAMGVGGSFDFVSGHQKRAPKLFRKLGLEWAYRLFKHPERAGRIWNATWKFVGLF